MGGAIARLAAVGLASTLLLAACGGTSSPAVPDVRGLRAPDAMKTLADAGYCPELRPGTSVARSAGMPVQQQSPRPGAQRRRGTVVTLVVGLPLPVGHGSTMLVRVDGDVFGPKPAC